jgi:hypothetical protein
MTHSVRQNPKLRHAGLDRQRNSRATQATAIDGSMRTPARVSVAGVLLLLPSIARAQVNSEPLRTRIKEQGFSIILQGTFDGRTGNTQGLTADGLVGAGVATDRHLAFAFASIDYSKLNGTLGVDKSFAHGRYDYELTHHLWWEVFAQAQSDVFQRIKLRDLFGMGPRLALYRDKQLGLYLGVAYMFERDVLDVQAGADEARVQLANRASVYLTAHAVLSDGIDAVTTTYVQPRLDRPSDIRIQSESGFLFKVSSWLSTSISFVAHYDSDPAVGVLPTDTELKNAITVTR